MTVFLTGGTGFIGGAIARVLRSREIPVVALVRDRSRAGRMESLGCEIREGDLSSDLRELMAGCTSLIHSAAMYKVGIARSQRKSMFEANVEGTKNAITAALEAGLDNICYISTVNVFGDTHSEIVNEGYRRDLSEGFLSCYDETKYLAHVWVEEQIEQGAPIKIAQPGVVYGPGDTSEVANLIEQVRTGKLKFRVFPATGFTYVFVDDAAQTIVSIHDKGRVGQSYVVGGEIARAGDLMDAVARLAGRKPPSVPLPAIGLRAMAPIGPVIGKVMGFPPNLFELIKVMNGVTYWASDQKARDELGHDPRSLADGLSDTLAPS